MKRFHVHVHVADLQKSIAFYTQLFGAEPARVEADYAKWMIDDPAVNFAISNRTETVGLDHLGFQTDDPAELAAMKARAAAADMALLDEGETTCCYARSEKHWITDPQGIAWEHFHTLETIPVFREATGATGAASGCCTPQGTAPATAAPETTSACCGPSSRGKPLPITVQAVSPKCC